MYSTLLKIMDKLVAHRTTENHSYLETGKMYLILSSYDENTKQLLYFWGTENCSQSADNRLSLKFQQTVPNLKVHIR